MNQQKLYKRKIELMMVGLVFTTIFFMASIWAIDIGASGMRLGITAVEGFSFMRTPSQQYHIVLAFAVTIFFAL